jgi:hypothetical protein
MNYEVIDDFLDQSSYNNLKGMIEDDVNMPWFFKNTQVSKTKDSFYFYHVFYTHHESNSPLFPSINNLLLSKMDIKALINVRANLVTNTYGYGFNNKHTDNYTGDHSHKTAIFYLGTNNGSTILYLDSGEKEIETVDNRLLIFDSGIKHHSKHQTDVDRRIVININYF